MNSVNSVTMTQWVYLVFYNAYSNVIFKSIRHYKINAPFHRLLKLSDFQINILLIAIDTILLFFHLFYYSYIRIFLLNGYDPCPAMLSLVKMLFSCNNLINLFFFFICTGKSELQNSAMLGIIILAILSVVIILLIACTYISEKMPAQNRRPTRK